jgi:hypothetical protein
MLMLDNYRWNAFTNRWVKGEPPYLWGYRWLRPDPPLAPKWSDTEDIRSFLNDKWVWPEGDRNDWLRDGLSTFQLHEQHQTTMTKFKKGDRVKINNPGGVRHTSTGVIDSVCMNGYIVAFDGGGHNLFFGEPALELVDQPLSTTPDKVLQAAKTSPQAKDALKALFPDVFKDWPLEIRPEVNGEVCAGVWVGDGQNGLRGRYLLAGPNVIVRAVKNNEDETIVTFHEK